MAQELIDDNSNNNSINYKVTSWFGQNSITNFNCLHLKDLRINIKTLENLTIGQILKHHQFIIGTNSNVLSISCPNKQRDVSVQLNSSAQDILDNCETDNWDSDLASDNLMVICRRMR